MAAKINLSRSDSQRFFIQERSARINNAFASRCSLTVTGRRTGIGPTHGGDPATIASPSMAIDDEAIYSMSQIKSLTEAGRNVDADLAHPIDHAFSGVRHRLVSFR
jgi:hypothetical protein